jgi:hypothetical protein
MRTYQRISRHIRPAIALPVLAVLALGGFLLLGLGCNENTRNDQAMAAPAINPRLPDVPVPFGLKFDTDRSSDRMVNGVRQAEHLYTGDASMRLVAEFYRHQMPAFGWTQREENLSGGRQRFTFEKGNENCYISIWDDWGTKLLIKVMAKGAKASEPAPKTPATRPAGK